MPKIQRVTGVGGCCRPYNRVYTFRGERRAGQEVGKDTSAQGVTRPYCRHCRPLITYH